MTVAKILSKAIGAVMSEVTMIDKIEDEKGKTKTIKTVLTEPMELPPNTYCKMSGELITHGYRIVDICPDAMNDYVGIFSGIDGYVSYDVANMFANDWHLGGIVAFEDGTMYKPMVSPESAELQGRIAWRDIIKEIANKRDSKVVILFTTDFQKRFWHRCRVGYVGSRTPVMIHDSGNDISNSFYIDWDKLIEIHAIVREIRSDGFKSAKNGIAYPLTQSLMLTPKIEKIGISKAQKWESVLRQIRHDNYYELFFACLCEGYKI